MIDDEEKNYKKTTPVTKAEQLSTKFGDRQFYEEAFEKQVVARGRGAIGTKKITPKSARIFDVKTTQTPLASDVPEMGYIASLTRGSTSTKAEFIGILDPHNLLLAPVSHAGAFYEEQSAMLRIFFGALKDKVMDEHYARILIFDDLGAGDCHKTISEDRAEWVYRITADRVVNKNLELIFQTEMKADAAITKATIVRSAITEKSTIDEVKAADTAVTAAVTSFIAGKRKDLVATTAAAQIILAKSKADRTQKEVETLNSWLLGPRLWVDIPIDLVERSEASIIEWFNDKKVIEMFMDKAREYQTFPALLFKMREAFKSTHGVSNIIQTAIEGTSTLTGTTDWTTGISLSAKSVKADESLKMLANATGVSIPEDDTAMTSFTGASAKSIALRDVMYRVAEKQDDNVSKIMMELATSLDVSIPTWLLTHEPSPIWTDRELWSCTGLGCTPEAVAVRIFLFHVFRTFAKIQYFSYRNDQVSVTFIDKSVMTMKAWFDKLNAMTIFDSESVLPKFWDEADKSTDMSKFMKTYASYRTMKFVFERPDGNTFTHFGLWDETISQLPELLEGFYFLDDLYAVANLTSNERHLLTSFKKHTVCLKDNAVAIFGKLKKAQPVFDIISSAGTNVLESLATSGILFGQNFDITHFGTYASSFPLYADGIIFGKPKIKPLLLSHYGWDEKRWIEQMGKQVFKAVFVRSKHGLLTHEWSDDYQIVRIRDKIDQACIPKDIKTYLGIGGQLKDAGYVLLSDINLKDIVLENDYQGSAGFIFRPGGH